MCDAKTYLLRVGMYDAKIDAKTEEIEHLREKLLRVTPVLKQDVVSGSKNDDKMGGGMAEIVDLQHEINACIDDYIKARAEVTSILDKVENKDHYTVLYKKYVLYASLEQISCEMGYSYRHICRLHGRALQAVNKILKGCVMNENS